MKNTWLFPVIESIHLMGLALTVGMIALPLADVRQEIWIRRGLALMFTTGALMFFADTARYLHNAAFLVKMAVLVAALVFHFTIHRRGLKWAAAVSLTLWSAVVVCGRLIADFDI